MQQKFVYIKKNNDKTLFKFQERLVYYLKDLCYVNSY